MALADIPSKEELIAKFMGSIRSPIYKFAYALQAIIDKNGEESGETASAEETAPTEEAAQPESEA